MERIQTAVASLYNQPDKVRDVTPGFNLSRNGKNVVVLMLDRALGYYVPYFMNERPELLEQFDGFTLYSNVISYGGYTNFGAPSLFGGYEYTPIEMNKRDTESLVSKHNEALKVMPVLFWENGYDVTVCDAAYANYQWIPDLSIYDEYPEINTYITEGCFSNEELKEYQIKNNRRNFFCFSIMKVMPLVIQENIYENGNYNKERAVDDYLGYSNQVLENRYVAEGIGSSFLNAYNVLFNLSTMTDISMDETNTFLLLTNNTTHEPVLLQEPNYEPTSYVDNTSYGEQIDRYTLNGITLNMNTDLQVTHYQTNMATMIQLGKWFDYLRENDVYDNTRIILVSDHGRALFQMNELIYDESMEEKGDLAHYYPLLMVKDFGAEGFVYSQEFMTNADVPVLATNNLIENPINPFTGKDINNLDKTSHSQFITTSEDYDVLINNGNTFLPSTWYEFNGDDIWELDNWRFIEEECTIPTGALE